MHFSIIKKKLTVSMAHSFVQITFLFFYFFLKKNWRKIFYSYLSYSAI